MAISIPLEQAICAAWILVIIPPVPRLEPAPPAMERDGVVDGFYPADEGGIWIFMGVGGVRGHRYRSSG